MLTVPVHNIFVLCHQKGSRSSMGQFASFCTSSGMDQLVTSVSKCAATVLMSLLQPLFYFPSFQYMSNPNISTKIHAIFTDLSQCDD